MKFLFIVGLVLVAAIVLVIVVAVWACCYVAGKADDAEGEE
jgi:hypothetical protein